ncbi:MAG: glycoside hydrolase family 3 C-terminal domain-containing protein [Candidatus Sulfotelmatobacter sp.]
MSKLSRFLPPVFLFTLALFPSPVVFGQAPVPSNPEIERRVDAILKKMTLEQKIGYIGGTGFAVRALPALGIPAFEMSDGPLGVRSNQKFPSTTYAAGIGLAASWDPQLAERVGAGIGKDARARGIHFMLGPGVNIYRAPMNGRNFEYFGEDPFLASAVATGYITGMQKQGVSSTVKHFLANNSEFLRHDSDSILDERTAREIYLPAFESAVKNAHAGAIMDSYNLVNGLHSTQNAYFNTDVVRKQWGFQGVMMSDWVATYDPVGAANGGLDLEMPTGAHMNNDKLLPAIRDGRVKPATIDAKVRHILTTAACFGWLDREQTDLSISKYNEEDRLVVLDAAREGIVLLKNEGSLLPLDKQKIKTVLVVGPDAWPAQPVAGGSGKAIPFSAVSILEGIGAYVGAAPTVYYERGVPKMIDLAASTEFSTAAQNGERGLKLETFPNGDLSGPPASTQKVHDLNFVGKSWDDFDNMDEALDLFEAGKKPSSRRWTGFYIAPQASSYEVAAEYSGEGNGYRLLVDDKVIFDQWKTATALQDHRTLKLSAGPHKIVAEAYQDFPVGGRLRVGIMDQHKIISASAKAVAAKADVVIIAAGFDALGESEGADRTFSLPFGQEELIRELAAVNKNTVVTVTSGGNVDPGDWLDRVPAYLELWYPGERGGTALAEILFGAVNPSGRLPVTFERRWADNPVHDSYYPESGTNHVVYKEGVFVGYRGYEHNHVKPLYPFGYGLSYTTFQYSHIEVKPEVGSSVGAPYTVGFDVTNTGHMAGADVAQVYVSEAQPTVPRPPKELKGFSRVELAPGETKHVTVTLSPRAFTFYDATPKHWHADAGKYTVEVGRSSEEIPLHADITLPGAYDVENDK